MKKILLIISIVIISIGLFVFGGFYLFARVIGNQRTCDWANIDNIEIHAHLDIPKVLESKCDYNAVTNTKKAFFLFDVSKLNVERYITHNGLEKVDSLNPIEYKKFLNIEEASFNNSLLYFKQSHYKDENTYSLVDFIAGKIWVTIEY